MSSSHFQYINNENVYEIFINGCKTGNLDLVKYCIEYANSINNPIDVHARRRMGFLL